MQSITTPVGWLFAALALGSMLRAAESAATDPLVYIGTYTGPKSAGIYLYRLHDAAATLEPLGLAATTPSPSFLALDPSHRFLFAVNEAKAFAGPPATGGVSAFAIDPATGKLTFINQRSSMGTDPCHLVVDRAGRHVIVANYSSGSVAVYPIAQDGRLGEPTAVIQHAGHGLDPSRQAGPHAHCITLDAANRFAFVCDLGLDQVRVYRFDGDKGTLTPAEPAFVALKPGAGPRHLAFSPDEKFAYVINELDSTITIFAHDAAQGRLREIATVSTLPAGYTGKSSGAEITVHPSGRWLYASNRGRDDVVCFAIDREKGTLTPVEALGSGGKGPRHFGLAPSGETMVIANQNSDTLLVARIDAATGRLTAAGAPIAAPAPVCTVFYTPPAAR